MATKGQILTTEPADLQEQHWGVVASLYWSGFLVLLLAGWVGYFASETNTWAGWVVGVVGLGYLGLAGWQHWTLRKLSETEEVRQALLAQRRLVSFGLFALVGLLLLAMVVLGFSEGFTQSFALFLSAVLFGIFGVVQGLWLLSPIGTQPLQDVVVATLYELQFAVMVVSFALALKFLGWAVFFIGWFEVTPVPEFIGSLGLFAVFLAAGTWLLVNLSSPELNLSRFRIFVLLIGGAVGIVVFTSVLLRFYSWGTDLLAGGLSAWRYDPDASYQVVQIWSCAYAGLLALALMFGSLYLAHADIRQNPTLRRLIYGYNAAFNGMMLLAILIVLNTVIYGSFPYTFNWTETQGFYSLSQRSKNMLQSLKKPTTVYVLMSSQNPNYADVQTLLGNCQAHTSKLRAKYVSPEQNSLEYVELKKQYKKINSTNGRGLLVAYGSTEGKDLPPYTFIEEDQLSSDPGFNRRDPDARPPHEFKGEALLMTQLDLLSNDKRKPVVYLTMGFEECLPMGVVNQQGIQFREKFWGTSSLVKKLEGNNYVVKTLVWGARPKGVTSIKPDIVFSKKSLKDPHTVPEDANVLGVVWPKVAYSKEVFGVLENYLNENVVKKPDGTMVKGKLALLSSIMDHRDRSAGDLGWRDFLKDYGVDFRQDCLVMAPPERVLTRSRFVPSVAPKTNHPLVKPFRGLDFLLYYPRTVGALPGKASGYKVETILEGKRTAEKYVISESNPSLLDQERRYWINLALNARLMQAKSAGTPSVAVTVKDRDEQPRMVIFGEAMQLASDAEANRTDTYLDLVASSFAWLADRPGTIGIPPKKSNYYKMQGNVSAVRMIFLPFGLLTLGLFGIGIGVWVVRRR
ncbi:MAG: Gldg family protein [Gemmataceae bacterium]